MDNNDIILKLAMQHNMSVKELDRFMISGDAKYKHTAKDEAELNDFISKLK